MKKQLKYKNIILALFVILLCFTIVIFSFTLKSIIKKPKNILNINEDVLVKKLGISIIKNESKDYISYIVLDHDRDLTYTWQFEKDLEKSSVAPKNNELNVNLRLSIDADTEDTKMINEIVKQDKLIVTFDHVGQLPTKATVKINVSDKFKDGEKLYLYYYNPESKKIEFIEKNLKVRDGYVFFPIDHCSDYLITGAVINEAIGNPKHVNYVIIGLIGIVILLVIKIMRQSK